MSGSYRKGDQLGRGSATTVYLGHDERLRRTVAIKELDEPFASDDAFVGAFLAEASRMASVGHPNVLAIHEVDANRKPPWLIVELADGGTLRRLMVRGPGQPAQAVEILRQILSGLAAVHRQGLVHRNVKPENLFLCQNVFKIGDFGVAARADGRTLPFSSPKYVSPESLQTASYVGPAADLYSLGLVMYELLAGEATFRQVVDELLREGAEGRGGEDSQPWFRLHLGPAELPPIHTVVPNVPEALSRVVQKLTRKDPAARYKACDEALADLRGEAGANLSAPTGTLPRVPREPQGRRWLWIGLAAACLLVIAAFAGWIVAGRKPERKATVRPPAVRPAPPPTAPLAPVEPTPKLPEPEPFAAQRIPDAAALADALLAQRSPGAGLELDFEPSTLTPRPQVPIDAPLRFRLSSDRPGFAALFVVSSDGSIFLLYPNRARTELTVGSADLGLPLQEDLSAGFRIVASPPFGRDLVFAMTSTRALPPPPAGEAPSPWITVYRFAPGGVESPALDFARWLSGLRRNWPAETRLVSREMDVTPF